jgi:hypothetical protein
MGKLQGKMLAHVSEAILKRHARRTETLFGPEGYLVEWRLLRAVDPGQRSAPPPSVILTFAVKAATSSPAAP